MPDGKGNYHRIEDSDDVELHSIHQDHPSGHAPLECSCGGHVSERRRMLFRVGIWTVQLAILATSLSLFVISRSQHTSPSEDMAHKLKYSTFSPALNEVGDFSETITFNGTFDFPSVYRGTPNGEVDEAWRRITKVGPFSITGEDVTKMGKSDVECSKLPEDLGGGYMGTVEVFHQLHCLDLIRKYTYLDYYIQKSPKYWGDPLMRTHVDHCIEMLRQVLMCSSDLGIITYNFVEFRPEAWPDFNTVHKCRNFEAILDWYHKRELHTTGTVGGQITKSAGSFIVATPP